MDKRENTLMSALGSPRGMCLAVLLTLIFSFFLGRYPAPYFTPVSDLFHNELAREILLKIRVPRILSAFWVGMVLSASGTVFQMVFRNPLVDSGFLGVSGGAAFGASLAIVCFGGHPGMVQLNAAVFACLGLAASYTIAAAAIADHMILFGKKGLVAAGTTAQTLTEKNLSDTYGETVTVATTPRGLVVLTL